MKNLFTFLFVLFLSFSSAFAFVSPDNEFAVYNTDYPPTSESLHNEARLAESSAQWRRFSVNLIQALQLGGGARLLSLAGAIAAAQS